MQRLLFTALACLISVSVFGEVIRADINHDGESDKTTLITDSINQKSLFRAVTPVIPSIKVAGSNNIIGISLDCEKFYRSYKNRRNVNIDRYFFVKLNYTYVYRDEWSWVDFSGEGFNIIGIGIGGLRQKSENKFFDYSIGLGAIIDFGHINPGTNFYPFPIFSLGTRKITKNNNIIKYGIGLPELLHFGYVFPF